MISSIPAPTVVVLILSLLGPAAAPADTGQPVPGERLTPPETGSIPVAFVLSPGAVMIDFAGPWEVFQDVSVPGRGKTAEDTRPFKLFTVAASREPIRASAGLQIVPDYSFSDAPQPEVIVIPAQGSSPSTPTTCSTGKRERMTTTSEEIGS